MVTLRREGGSGMGGHPHGGAAGEGPVPLPREMVLASAGSGKTYHLSSRLIGLLALGEAPETIWASTFTRKAAAEILDRVLLRLAQGAMNGEVAQELAEKAWLRTDAPPPEGFLDREHCGRLLGGLTRSLHRSNIGTLDAFFVRVAGTFGQELGIPPLWRLVEGPREDRMKTEALEAVLAEGDSAVMAEMVRIMGRGEVRRGVHTQLFDKVEELLLLNRELDPRLPDPWRPFFSGLPIGDGVSEEEVRERSRALARALSGVEAPLTQAGTPNSNWERELTRLKEAVEEKDWKGLLGKGLGKKLVEGGTLAPPEEIEYYHHIPPPELATLLEAVVELARVDLGRSLVSQGLALGRLADRYEEAFQEVQKRLGDYRFQDITHLLREAGTLGTADTLYFRLDARIRHLLLDEFQDTSLSQWEVLKPLVEEVLSGGECERATILVADPKQSIYGWRGARPELVDRVKGRYGLTREELLRSYRSGPVILEGVAQVFRNLSKNSVIQEMEGGAEVAEGWEKDFYAQAASDPDQPGAVRLLTGPRTEGTGAIQGSLLAYAARMVGELHRQEPRASVGVLVRENVVVRYLIAALRALRIPASGEGGTPLTDTQPVNALLALLRMADHPGDRLARYHVAETPVGEMIGYTSYQAGAEANRLARTLRGRLLRNGYGATLDEWARELEGACDDLEWPRVLQLVELGFRWDAQRTLRPGDFVRFVERQRVDDPSRARVRVMTVHQSKGLQFDVVVLPHLYPSLEARGASDPVLPYRDQGTGGVFRLYPSADKGTRALFPELQEAHRQSRVLRLRDELSTLYVAMTRARYALHMVVPADGDRGPGTAKSPARLLRAALAPEEEAEGEGRTLYARGEEEWYRGLRDRDFAAGREPERGEGKAPGVIRDLALRPLARGRTRNLARRSPSALEGGGVVDLGELLRVDLSAGARLRGTVVHGWFQEVGWLEEGLPEEARLREVARHLAPGMSNRQLGEWLSDFWSWLETPAIRAALSRAQYPAGARVEQELPFLHRRPDGILQGYIDRLVLVEEGDRVVAAVILDYKTDSIAPLDSSGLESRVSFYRPQIEAYREAVAARYELDPRVVAGKLLFLAAGLVESA